MWAWVGRLVEKGGKLREAKGCEDAHNVRVVREIKVQRLVEWKGDGVVIKSDIYLGAGVS